MSDSAGPNDPQRRAELLKRLAREEGFDLVGVCASGPSEHLTFLRDWLSRGLHGSMEYLGREDAVERRGDPSRSLPGVRSVLVVGHNYHPGDPDREDDDPRGGGQDPSRGIIARYARGRDYHKVVSKGLERVQRRYLETSDEAVSGRAYVDTGPLLERELAERAGLGWFGRNTMLIHPRKGSYFFLGALLLDVEVRSDAPLDRDHCGSCRACLDACPTGALLGRDASGAPVMDATRCISYLTIENRGAIPRELRSAIGNRIYGCDICQEVCPFNRRFAEETTEPGYAARGPGERPVDVEAEGRPPHREGDATGRAGPSHPGTETPPLVELMKMTRTEWDAFSRGSAIRRAGYTGFKRNVAVAMGNWLASADSPPEEAVTLLEKALEDEEPLVREHAAWALERGLDPKSESMDSRWSPGGPRDRRGDRS